MEVKILLKEIKKLSKYLNKAGSPINWEKTLLLQNSYKHIYSKKGVFNNLFKFPIGIQFELTYKCNLNCIYCYNNSGCITNKDEISDLDWIRIANEAAENGIFECVISGGEPFLKKKLVFDILDIMLYHNVKILLITNGWFVDRQIVDKLSKYKYYYIQVSIDGHTPEIHDNIRGKRGSWERAIKTVLLIKDAKIPVCIAHTCLPQNIQHIGKMIDISFQLGADQIIADIPMYTGRAIQNKNEFKYYKGWKKDFYTIIKSKQKQYQGLLVILTSLEPAIQLRKNLIEPNKVMLIRPNGNAKLDCITPFYFGNVKNNTLKEIWDNGLSNGWYNDTVLKFIHNIRNNIYLSKKICGIPLPHLEDDLYVGNNPDFI